MNMVGTPCRAVHFSSCTACRELTGSNEASGYTAVAPCAKQAGSQSFNFFVELKVCPAHILVLYHEGLAVRIASSNFVQILSDGPINYLGSGLAAVVAFGQGHVIAPSVNLCSVKVSAFDSSSCHILFHLRPPGQQGFEFGIGFLHIFMFDVAVPADTHGHFGYLHSEVVVIGTQVTH